MLSGSLVPSSSTRSFFFQPFTALTIAFPLALHATVFLQIALRSSCILPTVTQKPPFFFCCRAFASLAVLPFRPPGYFCCLTRFVEPCVFLVSRKPFFLRLPRVFAGFEFFLFDRQRFSLSHLLRLLRFYCLCST